MSKNRRDAKLIKQDNGIFNLIYYLKPKRAYAEVYINKKFDVTNLVKYMEKLKEVEREKVILRSGAEVPIARSYKKNFNIVYQNFILMKKWGRRR